ncbi:hypothetical protein ACTPOE_16180 [Castellaniella sp. WN]
MTTVQEIRSAILAASLETSNHGETPEEGTLYLPLSHLKALRLDAHIVVGGRGVGKSFWTAALQSPALREQLSANASELKGIEVFTGFSEKPAIENYPNADTFSRVLANDDDPFDLWRSVVLRWVAGRAGAKIPDDTWPDTVNWLKNNPESAARLMQQARSWKGLIVFDALDRTSDDWSKMDAIVRGLLRTALWLKAFPGLYAKVFLREDQAERTVFAFPDASKLTATKAELSWARHDLHGLLWQRLINAPGVGGQVLRDLCGHTGLQNQIWHLLPEMKRESDAQKTAFERLAGPWMGRDKRRGVPYTWSVGHLADGRGRTSPRSFLAAIRQAVEDSNGRYDEHGYALHYESIKRGIQKASEIRVQEIAEDYAWVPEVLSVLEGMNVPVEFEMVRAKWEECFPQGRPSINPGQLPAQHLDRGWEGIREDLQRLGLLEVKRDGRMDMPDLYRVGFGLGRRGGVKPRSSTA